jgi:hypothetical protein
MMTGVSLIWQYVEHLSRPFPGRPMSRTAS